MIYSLVTLYPTHSQTNWQCFNNSCTWQLRTQPRKLPGRAASCLPHWQQLPTTFFCSPSLIMLQTPLGNHILLLQYDLSPPLTTHFLIKCLNAMFYRREVAVDVQRIPSLHRRCFAHQLQKLASGIRPPLPLAKCYPHPVVDCLALFLQHFWLTHYLLDST